MHEGCDNPRTIINDSFLPHGPVDSYLMPLVGRIGASVMRIRIFYTHFQIKWQIAARIWQPVVGIWKMAYGRRQMGTA